ncbi:MULTISPECIES: vitamin B12 ABC transporter permease BtuC [Pantoea]|uniref:Vitamin B12 import system permease protein BtuC n=1 Tax=Pantoea brenneri TaxID=472694 RepID=A0ABU9MH57_9GAMM|nr:vitamin B12 ABC transporter permease BtuC [Pantoea sp. 3.5.1]KKD33500.1 Vitamin B12 import system permease BtuC [Pantoea sp. 3.5.1]
MSLLDQLAHQADRRSQKWLAGLAIALLALLIVSLCAGDSWIAPSHWLNDSSRLFVWQLRLPRSVAVMLVGASLALCGVVMQALFTNPLAEPGLLGVSNGAGIGLVLGVLLGSGSLWSLSLAAMAGALIITLILLHFAHRQLSMTRLLLTGVALGIICSAIMTWAVYFSTSLDLRQLMYWMMGGFSGIDWRYGWMMLALLPVMLALNGSGRILNLLALGETSARQLGLSLFCWRNLLVLAMGWLVGVSVAMAGAIGFVGLVIPHLLRLSGISDHRYLLPASALAGASVLLGADIVARLALTAAELPIGVVTATLGAPLFIALLVKSSR